MFRNCISNRRHTPPSWISTLTMYPAMLRWTQSHIIASSTRILPFHLQHHAQVFPGTRWKIAMTSSLVCDVLKSPKLFQRRLKTYVCSIYVWADSLWKHDVQINCLDLSNNVKMRKKHENDITETVAVGHHFISSKPTMLCDSCQSIACLVVNSTENEL